MNRLISGMAPFVALALVAGCSGDPTDSLRGGIDKLVASPSQLFMEPGQTKTVEVGAVDEQGNPLSEEYVVSAVGSGIAVRRDSSFLPVYNASGELVVPATAPRFRFIVEAAAGNSFGATSFTVSAAGKDLAIPVQLAPTATLEATFSNTTPALGEAITITAPAGVKFTPGATLQFPGAPLQPKILSRSADSTSITFLVPPNAGGPLRVNGVLSPSVPDSLSPLTTLSLTTPLIDTVDAVFSTTAPAVGQTVTLTLPPLMKFGGDSVVAGAVPLHFPRFRFNFAQQAAVPEAIAIAPDSSSLTFQAPPNAAGVARIDSVIFPGGYAFSLPTRSVTAGASIGTTVAVTFSNLNPALADTVTATAPANFRFSELLLSDTSRALDVGGKRGAIQSISLDSSQVKFIPLPGTGAPATINALRYTPAPQFVVTLPTVDTVRVPELTPLPNADDPATAPSLTLPPPGGTTTLIDAGGFHGPPEAVFGDSTRLYKVVLPVPATLTFTIEWYQGQFLFFEVTSDPRDPNATLAVSDGGPEADTFDEASPETLTIDLPAGTFFLAFADDNGPPNPDLFKITLQRAP